MNRNRDVQIAQVANGFILRPAFDPNNNRVVSTDIDVHVFQTFNELITFLSEHFEHRETDIRTDSE